MKNIFILCFMHFGLLCFSQSKSEAQIAAYKKDMNSEKYDAAIKKIDKLLKSDIDKYHLLCDKGICLVEKQKYDEALNTFSAAIEIYKDSSRAYLLRGKIFLTAGMEDKAVKDFTYALKFANNDRVKIACYVNRASARYNVRNYEGAYKDLMKGYELDSNNIGILNNLALVCDHVGKGEMTLIYLYRILEKDSMNHFANSNIGFKLQQDGKHEEAIPFFTKSIELSKDVGKGIPYCNRAYSKLQLGKIEEALNDIKKSLQIYPENAYAYVVYAEINIAQKDYKKACENIETAIKKEYTKMYGDKALQLENQYCK